MAVAFAYVESAVVEYLRALLLPSGAGRIPIPDLTLEQIHSWAKLMFAVSSSSWPRDFYANHVGCRWDNGGRKSPRGVGSFHDLIRGWDIFFYIWLKLFIDWPQGLMTWDLLFFGSRPVGLPSPLSCADISRPHSVGTCRSAFRALRSASSGFLGQMGPHWCRRIGRHCVLLLGLQEGHGGRDPRFLQLAAFHRGVSAFGTDVFGCCPGSVQRSLERSRMQADGQATGDRKTSALSEHEGGPHSPVYSRPLKGLGSATLFRDVKPANLFGLSERHRMICL